MSPLPRDPNVTTVYLGQYTHEHANDIAGLLEAAEISWWYKAPGPISSLWEHGVRLFVDRERLDEAREIAGRVTEGGAGKEAT
jgi:hypothetical protein